jgi:hypothetical protein
MSGPVDPLSVDYARRIDAELEAEDREAEEDYAVEFDEHLDDVLEEQELEGWG